jgi:putative ABC transport system ATP-binding protein
MALVEAENIEKVYQAGKIRVPALRGMNFSIPPGGFVAFIGPSGSGKSTLLNLIGCLDKPSAGRLMVLDTDIAGLDRGRAAAFRGANIGFVFQDFNLIPVLSAWENIAYPLEMVQRWPADRRKKRVSELLDAVGLADQGGMRPDQLSGGQKQRVAVARALAARPRLVLADEPTANLDSQTAGRIIGLMKTIRDEFDTTFIFSTHDARIVDQAEQIFRIEDGRLKTEET